MMCYYLNVHFQGQKVKIYRKFVKLLAQRQWYTVESLKTQFVVPFVYFKCNTVIMHVYVPAH